jgi:hypothetical protein
VSQARLSLSIEATHSVNLVSMLAKLGVRVPKVAGLRSAGTMQEMSGEIKRTVYTGETDQPGVLACDVPHNATVSLWPSNH